MTKPQNSNQKLLQLMLRAQYLSQQDPQSDRGYAMVIVSVISIFMFSLLVAYMTITNLSKSSTNAYIDGNNSFYVAESGLNRRASELRQKFEISNLPAGTDPATIAECYPLVIADSQNTSTYNPDNDFQCRNYRFRYGNSSATVTSNSGAFGGSTEVTNKTDTVKYVAYTFVKPKQNYSSNPPTAKIIASGEPFAGLNALEYKYTIYSTAKKPSSVNLVASTADAAEIAAKNKEISGTPTSASEDSLAASYDLKQATADATNAANTGTAAGNSSTNVVLQMDFKSRVVPLFQFAAFYEDDLETNSVTPMTISGPVHTNGNLKTISLNDASKTDFTLGTRFMDKVTVVEDVYHSSVYGSCNDCVVAVYKGSGSESLVTKYGLFPTDATTLLSDDQLAVFGDRLKSKVPRLNPPKPGFLREKNYVTNETGLYYGKADMRLKFFPTREMPFDFTSIQDGSGCDLTANKIPSDRQHSNALSCLQLTKGQLQSLRQPVLITTSTTLSSNDLDILKALKVSIAAADGTPLTLSDLDRSIDTTSATLSGWQLTFKNLLSSGNQTLLKDKTPIQIATERSSSFLPPPIQLITGTANSTDTNINGGFYNQITNNHSAFSTTNGTWMNMLQINIKSLTYWNRDGIYVEADTGNKNNLTIPYAAPTTLTLASGLSTNNLAFIKAAADTSKPASSFAYQGLAARDSGVNATEGGLVFHATVSDDTNGNGSNEIIAPITNQAIPGKDAKGDPIARVDNYRSYPGITGIRKSPYGFVVSGGVELPGPLTIATDQAAYIQGDYNNPGDAFGVLGGLPRTDPVNPSDDTPTTANPNPRGYYRQPAAIMADTITFLSNECENANQQVNCGSNTTAVRSRSVVTKGIAINAALLSNIMKSTSTTFNGGLNKYMKHLENWDRETVLNYTGSMVSLGEPLESDKIPVNDYSVYKRNYNYETRFNSFEKLPPLSPSAVYLRQDVFRRNY
jgi:Tfp pilus assembly protein PilX